MPVLIYPVPPLPTRHTEERHPSPPMSSHQTTKKKTLAQSRAEKEQRLQDLKLGSELAAQVAAAADRIEAIRVVADPRYDELHALLPQANKASELLRHHSDPIEVLAVFSSRPGSITISGRIP